MDTNDTIIALATPPGTAALATLRISGKDAIACTNQIFSGKNLEKSAGYSLHYGTLVDGKKQIDEVLVSVFRAPKSFTGEDMTEISCHGSPYVVQQIVGLYHKKGVRYAKPGEFSRRAFLNGKADLTQIEAIADLISAESEQMHQSALRQMRGGFSEEIGQFRAALIHFAAMLELELDFSEEDLTFADRSELRLMLVKLCEKIEQLIASFSLGNVLKNGIPVAIVGKPNTGKSTLLNALLNEEKAIVSEIPGTTRDFIEDEILLDGIRFRFIDTAGLRQTNDPIEQIGQQKTQEKIEKAGLILYVFDVSQTSEDGLKKQISTIKNTTASLLLVGNKTDLVKGKTPQFSDEIPPVFCLSAHKKADVNRLKQHLAKAVSPEKTASTDTLVTNLRHIGCLRETLAALQTANRGISEKLGSELLAIELRYALHHLSEITGSITTEDLLDDIFSNFCIGK